MDMPCPCPLCGEWVELNDMVRTDNKNCDEKLVCEECYEKLESDDEDLEEYLNERSNYNCDYCGLPLTNREADHGTHECDAQPEQQEIMRKITDI